MSKMKLYFSINLQRFKMDKWFIMLGWYTEEPFRLFNISLLELDGFIILLDFQITWFCFIVGRQESDIWSRWTRK